MKQWKTYFPIWYLCGVALDHPHKGMDRHAHHGYYHNENDGPKGATNLTQKEKKMIANIEALWYNHIGK